MIGYKVIKCNNKLNLAGWSGFDGSVEYAKVYLITGAILIGIKV